MTKEPSGWTRVSRVEDLKGEGPFAVSAGVLDLVVVRVGGALRAYQGLCPHQGALLGEGELEGGVLLCRNHRWRFDAATGQRQGGSQCLQACPLKIADGAVYIDPSPLSTRNARRATRSIGDLPGPRRLPLLGNMLDLDLPRLHLILEQWAREYGPIYAFGMGPRAAVALSDPDLITQVLRERPESFRRTNNIEPIFRELGCAGVFSVEGEAWRPQRKLVMEALSNRNLRGFYPLLHRVAARLTERWQATAGSVRDVRDEMTRFTMDVTILLVFGYDLDTLSGQDDRVQQNIAAVLPAVARRLFSPVPYWRVVRLPQDRRVDRAVDEVEQWVRGRIAEARRCVAEDPARAANPQNLLEAMAVARDSEGRPFSDEIISGNAMTMLLAAEDTTANTLAWAVHHLCDSAQAVSALHAELREVLGDAAIAADAEQASRLRYATAIAHETMRLRPIGPVFPLEANDDVVLGDVALPKGTPIMLLARLSGLSADNFGAPDEFRPERWLTAEGDESAAHRPAAIVPFGSGPRMCPGRNLALLEMRVVLAALYQNFTVERVGSPSEVQERYEFTMNPQGLRARLQPRRADASPARS